MTDAPYGLYIHIPFCISKCRYCDFYSITEKDIIPGFIISLKEEASLYREYLNAGEIDTVYIGGGTPSVLSIENLGAVLSQVYKSFKVSRDCEITVEANPQDITWEYAKNLKNLDIDRVSLGVQSFRDKDLLFLGRRHNSGESGKSIDLLYQSGFESVNIDLIWGIPGQSFRDVMDNLRRAVSYSPAHISAYELTYAKNTPLWNEKREGRVIDRPEVFKEKLFFAIARFLKDKGYIHYEVSNYSLGLDSLSKHNAKYWNHSPYLGLGPSAHSFDGKRRWWNYSSVKGYCDIIRKGNLPVQSEEILTDKQYTTEEIMLGLRTSSGFDISILKPGEKNKDILNFLLNQKFIIMLNKRAIPTEKGMLNADYIAGLFHI